MSQAKAACHGAVTSCEVRLCPRSKQYVQEPNSCDANNKAEWSACKRCNDLDFREYQKVTIIVSE